MHHKGLQLLQAQAHGNDGRKRILGHTAVKRFECPMIQLPHGPDIAGSAIITEQAHVITNSLVLDAIKAASTRG